MATLHETLMTTGALDVLDAIHGETVTITTPGGVASSITAIIESLDVVQEDRAIGDAREEHTLKAIRATIKTSDVTTLTKGYLITRGTDDFVLRDDSQITTEAGFHLAMFELTENTGRASNPYRSIGS